MEKHIVFPGKGQGDRIRRYGASAISDNRRQSLKKEFSVTRRWRSATYEIHVTNPKDMKKGVASITMDQAETGSEHPYRLLAA